MPRKSKMRVIFTSRWLRWAILRSAFRILPRLGKHFNFYTDGVAARHVATTTIFEEIEKLCFVNLRSDLSDRILLPSMKTDAGDTSTYPQSCSVMHTSGYIIEHCCVLAHTMSIIHEPTKRRVMLHEGHPNWNEAKPVLLKLRARNAGVHYCLPAAGHYYHFFANDIVPLLHYLEQNTGNSSPLTFVLRNDAPQFAKEVVSALCKTFSNLHLLYIAPDERLEDVSILFLSRIAETREWMPIDKKQADILLRMMESHYTLPRNTAKDQKIFITRGNARLRRLHNEAEIKNLLQGEGFSIFEPAAGNHSAQVETFQNADIIVCVHGAALTNLIFCKPGTTVVELFPENHIKSTYLWLANVLGLKYYAAIGTKADLWQGFRVEPRDVQAALTEAANFTHTNVS